MEIITQQITYKDTNKNTLITALIIGFVVLAVVLAIDNFYLAKIKVLPVKQSIGCISSGYGYRASPFFGGMEFHPAIDIAAKEGTPLFAVTDGVV